MATKKSSLRQQYNRQINRIRKGYRDIESRGGSFSKSLDEIIRPVKNPTEATIRRLRNITKESLYRQATTDTGKSGYSILTQRRSEAGKRGASRKRSIDISWELFQMERGITIPRQERNLYQNDFASWNYLKQEQYEHNRWYHNVIEIPRAIEKLNKYKETKRIDRAREKWQKEYLKEQQEKFEKGLAQNPRLDAVDNFLHLTPEEFKNLQVTGKVEYSGKGANRNASIVDVNLVDTSTGEIIESSDRGVTPVEVNGTIYQYDAETNRFIPSGHISREAKERWYKEEYSPSEDIEIDTPYEFTDEAPEDRTYGNDGYDDEDDEPNPYDDIYVDSNGEAHYDSELQDYIDTKLDNIYDRMDELDVYGEQLKDELDSALSEMNNADKARFLDEFGDDLEASLEAESHYFNDKDGDIRSNEKGFNHFHSKSLNIIWNGAVPLSSVSTFYN